MHKYLPLLGMMLLLSACPRAPKLVRPEVPVPSAWPDTGAAAGKGAPLAAETQWREFFVDGKLRAVIDLALKNNRDLRAAALAIDKFQALYRIQRAESYPTVSVSGGAEFYRLPGRMSATGQGETVQQYNVNLGVAAWEPDFFGRIRSLKSAALEQYLATKQARSATQVSLVAAVAETFLALAADRENLRLARATLETQQASRDLIRKIVDMGMTSELDLRQAESQVEAARVDIARYTGQIELDRNALDLLVGAAVPDDLLPEDLETAGKVKDVSPGLPSEVLLSRPDILLAEHQLKAAEANIGAARAAFFPRITLTGGLGFMSGDLLDLFKFGSRTWNFAPQVVLPIFDYGSRKANYQSVQVDREIYVATYEKAIQSAFREVSDALELRKSLLAQQEAQQALVNSLEATFRLSEARYREGIDGYLVVLVAQRALYVAQQRMLTLRLARAVNLVSLYKVLGGGASGPAESPGKSAETSAPPTKKPGE
ncbi:MAG: efflux transporter outer membrane subunit [Acidobacteria bacterium]|nr:efflux transporter outer membrane subunit [Acidobacteriota bacterium]